jgi:hypothetical protein
MKPENLLKSNFGNETALDITEVSLQISKVCRG